MKPGQPWIFYVNPQSCWSTFIAQKPTWAKKVARLNH